MRKLLIFSLLLLPLAAAAQIYKTTDEAGNVVYSDKPPPNSRSTQTIELRQINTTPPPAASPALSADSEAAEEPAAIAMATITSPAPDTTIPMGAAGNFSVGAQISPSLEAGQSLLLLIDGQPNGGPQQGGAWSLINIFRGTHSLVVAVVDDKGQTLNSSEPVQVHVMRPSVNLLH